MTYTGRSVVRPFWQANYLGISVAYWISFGLAFVKGGPDNLEGWSSVRWRFLLAFQCVPAIILAIFIRFLPDSPRFLASVGRHEEALEVLEHVRGKPSGDADVEREYQEIVKVSKGAKKSSPIEFAKILCDLKHGHDSPHLTRRAWLCLWLQIMASWTGITGEQRQGHTVPTGLLISLSLSVQPSPLIRLYFCLKPAILLSSKTVSQEDSTRSVSSVPSSLLASSIAGVVVNA